MHTIIARELEGLRDTLEGTELAAIFTPPPAPKRRKARPVIAPPLSYQTFSVIGPDGRLGVSVALQGVHGAGKRIVADAIDWERVVKAFGDRWTVKESKPGYAYVVGMGKAAGTVLARVLCRAAPSQTVSYRDQDTLNL